MLRGVKSISAFAVCFFGAALAIGQPPADAQTLTGQSTQEVTCLSIECGFRGEHVEASIVLRNRESSSVTRIRLSTSTLPPSNGIQRIMPISLGWLAAGTYDVSLPMIYGRMIAADATDIRKHTRINRRNTSLNTNVLTIKNSGELSTIALIIESPIFMLLSPNSPNGQSLGPIGGGTGVF